MSNPKRKDKGREFTKNSRLPAFLIGMLSIPLRIYLAEEPFVWIVNMKKKVMFGWPQIIKLLCMCLALFVIAALCVLTKKEAKETETVSVSSTAQAGIEQQPELQLYAKAAVLMDAQSGRVLYEKCGDEVLPMASTTKILTCILALEKGNLEDEVEISAYAASMPKVKLYIKQGEHYRLKDLLYSLMLESHNDSAVAIAEHVGGSVEGFAAMMNEKAREIGCESSFFITPNGLDAVNAEEGKSHSTTARELALIMSYCITKSEKKEEFLEITRTPSYSFSNDKGRSFSCSNHNAFLTMMEGALSGKTGFTNKAGYCYVGALKREERTFVVALLACGWPNHKTYKWSDCRQLMDYGLQTYHYQDVFQTVSFPDIPVEEGIAQKGSPFQKAEVALTLNTGDTKLEILMKDTDRIEIEQKLPKSLNAPVAAGMQAGEVIYRLNGEVMKTYPVVTAGSVQRLDLAWIVRFVFGKYAL